MPTPEQVERAIAEIGKLYANYEYFFQKNDSPDWLEPLWQRNFFKNPLPPKDERGGSRSFPNWPESQYLVRMAPKAPELVARIVREIPASENIFVHSDIVEAALALPGRLAAPIAERERRWIRSQSQLLWLLPDRYSGLVVHLAESGETAVAFRMARDLLEVMPHPRLPGTSDDDALYLSREPVAKMEHWDYERAIEKTLPTLVAVDSLRCLALFGDLLQEAMRLAEPVDGSDESDHSYIWRRAVEDHSQNGPHHSIRDALVAGLRDTAEGICRHDPGMLATVVEHLEKRKRSIFQRVALHILAIFGSTAPELTAARLARWDLLNQVSVRHEYVRLAQAHFKDVSDEDKEALLGNLGTLPPMDNYRKNFPAMFGRAPTDEDIGHAQKRWELEKLAALRGLLPEKWQRRYEELLGGRAEPKHPEFPSYVESGWVGPTSPKSSDDLAALPVDQLTKYLRTWKPSRDPFDSSEEGLGRQLAAAVAANPTRLAAEADQFRDLAPTYVRSLLDGFEKALKADREFEWPKVLDVCEHVVAQPMEPDVESASGDLGERDPGWRWARGSVADLLEEAFSRKAIPAEHRYRAWEALKAVTDDPNPSPEHEAKYGGSNMDPLTLSLNTNRGKAMHAVVRYALWIRQTDERDHPERIAEGFDVMPEVRDVLDVHLDAGKDPSLTVRSIYGQWFPWFVLLDARWAQANVDRIFPGDTTRALHDAAWEAYLANSPYDNTFELLRDQYRAAVDDLADASEEAKRSHFPNPRERLTEHLMILFLRGKLTFEEAGSLLARFFEIAPEDMRAHAIEFIGRVLQGEGEPTEQQIERLRDLWRRRVAAFADCRDGHVAEVGMFGWWFASSGRFPDDWLMTELLQLLERRVPVEDAHSVVERLADLARTRPLQAIRALRLMLPIQSEPRFLLGLSEPPRRLIGAALASSDLTARKEARELLNELVARGYPEYDTLADETPG